MNEKKVSSVLLLLSIQLLEQIIFKAKTQPPVRNKT